MGATIMNAIVPVQKPMLLDVMAEKYSLRPEEFSKTVRATCGLATATAEQFAAFLIVAKTYDLNPILKEIYAYPAKGGGIVPIVSIDGWVNLVNSHGACDGFEFEMVHDDKGDLVACTCKMYRKDRKHPVTVTEYLSECRRATEPWKMAHRMLRHKSLIQAARYAFGFAGVYDEDEGRVIADAVDVTPKAAPRVPSPTEVEQEVIPPDHGSDKYKPGDEVKLAGPVPSVPKDDPISSGPQRTWMLPKIEADYDVWMEAVLKFIAECQDGGELESFFNAEIESRKGTDDIFPSDTDDLVDAYTKRQQALNADE
jgi:phage recombination protein Bet